MGLLQDALETYENMSHLVGIPVEGKAMLAPVAFLSSTAKHIVTLDLDGNFISAEDSKEKVIFPCTEASCGRTNGAATAPHPLCDTVKYFLPENTVHYESFVAQLEDWYQFDPLPVLNAVLAYVKKGTLGTDVAYKDDNELVVWRVLNSGKYDEVWKNPDIQTSYKRYYDSKIADREHALDYITGEYTIPATQSLKGIVPKFGSAKLVSCNDDTNFTYRGRFIAEEEAMMIGFESSQKAHNALKWLIMNDSVSFGKKTFLCWSPTGRQIPKIASSVLDFGDEEKHEPLQPTEYREQLYRKIAGYKQEFDVNDRAIIAIFDAATTGRLSIQNYQSMNGSALLDRLADWDMSCCWLSKFGVQAPSLYQLVLAMYGVQHKDKIEIDKDSIRDNGICRLLLSKINGVKLPYDMMQSAVHKCNNLNVLTPANRYKQLNATCALIRKYYYDNGKEIEMYLEPEKLDRSYQFGRLLAILEKAERDTFKDDCKREPNAVRMQAAFALHPATTAKVLIERVKTVYFPQLSVSSRKYYDHLIGDIYGILAQFEEATWNRPLNEMYLIGYYLERNDLYTKHNNKNNNTEEN